MALRQNSEAPSTLSGLTTLRHFRQSPAQLAPYFLHCRGRAMRVMAHQQILSKLFLGRLREAVHDDLPSKKIEVLASLHRLTIWQMARYRSKRRTLLTVHELSSKEHANTSEACHATASTEGRREMKGGPHPFANRKRPVFEHYAAPRPAGKRSVRDSIEAESWSRLLRRSRECAPLPRFTSPQHPFTCPRPTIPARIARPRTAAGGRRNCRAARYHRAAQDSHTDRSNQ